MTEAAPFQPPPVPPTPPTIDITGTTVPPVPPAPPAYQPPPNPGVPRMPSRDPAAAVLLEILPGLGLQTFGIGNIYAGNILSGVLIMVGYWASCLVNFGLCFLLIGFLTWPLTWLAFAAGASYLAYQKAKSTQLAA